MDSARSWKSIPLTPILSLRKSLCRNETLLHQKWSQKKLLWVLRPSSRTRLYQPLQVGCGIGRIEAMSDCKAVRKIWNRSKTDWRYFSTQDVKPKCNLDYIHFQDMQVLWFGMDTCWSVLILCHQRVVAIGFQLRCFLELHMRRDSNNTIIYSNISRMIWQDCKARTFGKYTRTNEARARWERQQRTEGDVKNYSGDYNMKRISSAVRSANRNKPLYSVSHNTYPGSMSNNVSPLPLQEGCLVWCYEALRRDSQSDGYHRGHCCRTIVTQ